MMSSRARMSLALGALGAAGLMAGGMHHGGSGAQAVAPGVIAFEKSGQRCYTILGSPGTNGGGRGGDATVCGEGAQAKRGAGGGSTETSAIYAIRDGKLVRILADGRMEPVEVR